MISSKSPQWSGVGISNGRQRLLSSRPTVRNFSVHAINRLSLVRLRPGQHSGALRLSQLHQYRSISLFGWRSSSQTSTDEFATSHSTPQDIPPTRDTVETWDLKPATLDPSRSVKASHATSDAPDPSILSPPYTPEPKILHDLENAVAAPHDAAAPSYETSDLSTAAEYVGYLKNTCGLDYGWGPTAFLQNVIEHLHVNLGLSWALAIPALALVCHAVFVYPSVRAADVGARMRTANPILKPLRNEYMEAAKAKDQLKMKKIRDELRAVNQEYGISTVKMFVPLLIQIPIQFGAFRLLRGMAALPVPAFEYEKWLWTTDLTIGDPYFILPVVSSALIYLNFKTSLLTPGSDTAVAGMQKMMMIGFPFLNLVFMSFQPGAVQLFFVASSALVLTRTNVLNVPWLRSKLGVYPAPKPESTVVPLNTYQRTTKASKKDVEVVSTNRSAIDKVVDILKSKGSTFTDGFRTVKTQALGKVEDKQKARVLEKAEVYEAERRLKLDAEREKRNRTKTIGGMRISPGVIKNEERKREVSNLFEDDQDNGTRGKRRPGR